MTAFVDSYSFSHRFSGDTTSDTAGYQEIIHQCQEVNATGLTRQFFQFAMGCGYGPQNIIDAFVMLAKEYEDAYGYNQEKNVD
jgi:hypothetical protein